MFYLLDIITSLIGDTALHGTPLGVAADRFAAACYVVVTIFLFSLLRVVNRPIAVLTACFSLLALAIWTFGQFLWDGWASSMGNIAFGVYCLLAGYLIYRSTFLPRVVGAAMALGGMGLLAYVSPQLVSHLYPYNVIPALVGEISLMVSLLVVGISVRRFEAIAAARETGRRIEDDG